MMHDRIKKVLSTHCNNDFFLRSAFDYRNEVIAHTVAVLAKDLGHNGDITSTIVLQEPRRITARIISKSQGVLAGMRELHFFLKCLPECGLGKIEMERAKKDGSRLKKADTLVLLRGNAADILKIERTALNLLQRMSGVATLTRRFVEKVPANILITPTRKTLWGLLDKRACLVGGGGTHRLNLSDAVLIKDTHLQLLQGNFERIFKALASAKSVGKFIEIEVETVKDALTVAQFYYKYLHRIHARVPFYLMLDNMLPSDIKKAVRELKRRKLYDYILLEASGGVTLKNVSAYAKSGVDVISVGALTHSAPALDMSLKIV